MNSTTETASSTAIKECPIIGFLPFTVFSNPVRSYGLIQPPTTTWVYTHVASALLAVDHFNERNPVVVPQLAELQECSVHLPDINFYNSDGDVFDVARAILERQKQGNETCSIVGPYFDRAVQEASHLANGLDIPLVTHGGEERALSVEEANPRVAQTSVNFFAITKVIISYLQYWKREGFLVSLATISGYGDGYREAMESSSAAAGYEPVVPIRFGPAIFRSSLEEASKTGYRNFFVAVDNADESRLVALADLTEEFGLNTPEHFWMISGNIDLEQLMALAARNTNVTKWIRGMAAIRILDGFTHDPSTDAFLKLWKNQNKTLVQRANAQYPRQLFQASEDYFQTNNPVYGAGFMYDAVMTIGLSLCGVEEKEASGEGVQGGGGRREPKRGAERRKALSSSNVRGAKRGDRAAHSIRRELKAAKGAPKRRNAHFDAILKLKFEGATGELSFGADPRRPGARNVESVVYGAYNIRAIEPAEATFNPNFTTWFYLTHTLKDTITDGTKWKPAAGAPFIFASGGTAPPARNRDLPEQNYISDGVQVAGLLVMSVALTIIVASSVLVYVNRKSNCIQRNQPPFLYLLMAGAFIFTSTIFTLSFDEDDWSEESLNRACMAAPWLLAIGYSVMYLALFSKLFRVDQVMQFKKRTVRFRDVIKPFVAVMILIVTVLTLWSALDPFVWKRREIDEVTGESYGRCHSDHTAAYALTLAGLMAITTIACGCMAYKCRDVDARFSDASWIFHTIYTHVQAIVIGLSVVIILNESSADATYLGRSLMIFVISVTTVCLMIGPKVAVLLGFVSDAPAQGPRTDGRGAGRGAVKVSGMTPTELRLSVESDPLRTDIGTPAAGREANHRNENQVHTYSLPKSRPSPSEVSTITDQSPRSSRIGQSDRSTEELATTSSPAVSNSVSGSFDPERLENKPCLHAEETPPKTGVSASLEVCESESAGPGQEEGGAADTMEDQSFGA